MRTELGWMRRAAAVAALAAAPAALACGLCVEDRVAAVYDPAVIAKATAARQQVAFYGVEGALVPGDAVRREMIGALERAGVRGSARMSFESATASVAFDPRRTSAQAVAEAAGRALAARGLTLQPLRVTDATGTPR